LFCLTYLKDITDDEDDVTVIAEDNPVSDTDDSEDDVILENESSGEDSDGEPDAHIDIFLSRDGEVCHAQYVGESSDMHEC
jgi:hypothetical protein